MHPWALRALCGVIISTTCAHVGGGCTDIARRRCGRALGASPASTRVGRYERIAKEYLSSFPPKGFRAALLSICIRGIRPISETRTARSTEARLFRLDACATPLLPLAAQHALPLQQNVYLDISRCVLTTGKRPPNTSHVFPIPYSSHGKSWRCPESTIGGIWACSERFRRPAHGQPWAFGCRTSTAISTAKRLL